MKHSIVFLLGTTVLLAACVDTTGLSPQSSKKPLGSDTASVTLTEYSDFECPACRVSYELLVKPVMAKYGSQLRLEFKQFPLLTIHPLSLPMAEASECAADQGKFWEFVDKAYGTQLQWDQENAQNQQSSAPTSPRKLQADDIATWAQDLGLDMDLFDRCTRSHIKRGAIMAEFDAGQNIGVNGTPTFFVNGTKVENNAEESLSAAIDAALQAQAGRKL